MRKDINSELASVEYKKELERLTLIRNSIIKCLQFSLLNSMRDGISGDRNFFLRMIDDIFQSVISIDMLAREGIVNTCRRELRYLVELAIKSSFIESNSNQKEFEKKINEYEKLLNSSNINFINKLTFRYFDAQTQEEFKTFVKRSYGYLSKFTHASSYQILERFQRVENGVSIGYEGIKELDDLNTDIERVFSIIVILIFHSVADYVVGDFLVEPNGDTINWYFNKSKFVCLIDEHYDYKIERQGKLEKLKKQRKESISF